MGDSIPFGLFLLVGFTFAAWHVGRSPDLRFHRWGLAGIIAAPPSMGMTWWVWSSWGHSSVGYGGFGFFALGLMMMLPAFALFWLLGGIGYFLGRHSRGATRPAVRTESGPLAIAPTIQTIHVFTAFFSNKDEALAYTQPHWEPEPAEEVGAEEYEAWEDRNPSCMMKEDLGFDGFLDEDFVETIWRARSSGNDIDWNYLSDTIGSANAKACKSIASEGANTLILIDAQAFGGGAANVGSTRAITYCGTFRLERVRFAGR